MPPRTISSDEGTGIERQRQPQRDHRIAHLHARPRTGRSRFSVTCGTVGVQRVAQRPSEGRDSTLSVGARIADRALGRGVDGRSAGRPQSGPTVRKTPPVRLPRRGRGARRYRRGRFLPRCGSSPPGSREGGHPGRPGPGSAGWSENGEPGVPPSNRSDKGPGFIRRSGDHVANLPSGHGPFFRRPRARTLDIRPESDAGLAKEAAQILGRGRRSGSDTGRAPLALFG